jgi:iron complex transport system ATP-binding protein
MLEVKNLEFAFEDKLALKGINLTVPKGEILGIVGPNGSGKSTLLRIISGVLAPSKGSVQWDGVDLTQLPAKDRARFVAMVSQQATLPDGIKVLDLVAMGRTPYLGILGKESGGDLEAIVKAMRDTDTYVMRNISVEKLSGGERQRVLLALALAQGSSLLLLDEPTASLDIAYETALLDTVLRLQQGMDGVVIMSIHNLTLAAQYCTCMAMMKNGSVIAYGHPSDVLTVENIRRVYETDVTLFDHPVSGLPVVVPISKAEGRKMDYQ